MPNVDLHYSGLESDQFVSLVMRAVGVGITLAAEVRGREPITSTPAIIVGRAVSASDEGYARTLRVQTDHGTHFNIGGTNTTKSIASESVVFLDVPAAVVASVADEKSAEQWLRQTREVDSERAAEAFQALVFGVRNQSLATVQADALREAALQALGANAESVRVGALMLLGLAGGGDALAVFADALTDDSTLVRRQAALRLRGMDSVIASDREAPAARQCVAALVEAILRDPDPNVRAYAAEDLGYFYDPAAISALHQVAAKDASLDVRWAATVAIGRTNDVDAVVALQVVLSREKDPSIRRAAFLGIGRQGPDLVRRSERDATKVAEAIGAAIKRGPDPGVDYALYALGEMGSAAAPGVDLVVEAMQTEDIQVLATALMTLARLLPYADPATLRQVIRDTIAERIHTPEPRDWPEVGFYRAFLNAAGELAMTLEDFALADDTFTIASRTTEQAAWLKDFYEGVALYARAECGIATGAHIDGVLDLLRAALTAFRRVQHSDAFAETDPARSGLSLKQTLAEARLAVLSALNVWRPHGFDKHDIDRVQQHLAQATEQYRRLDLAGLSATDRRLSGQEVSLVVCLQMIVEVLDEICHLATAVVEHEPAKVQYALAQVKERCRKFAARAGDTQSVSLVRIGTELTTLIESLESSNDAATASELLDRIPTILTGPAPAPGTCPIVTFGVATVDVAVADAWGGDGTRERPYVVSARHELILEGTVYVQHRTKDDELIFEAAAHVPARSDALQSVPVHEGSYSLRPVSFGSLVPSSAVFAVTVNLSFRNRGCVQPVVEQEVWVCCREQTTSPHGQVADLPMIEAEISDLEGRIAELDGRTDRSSASKRRALENDLRAKKSEASRLRGSDEDDQA